MEILEIKKDIKMMSFFNICRLTIAPGQRQAFQVQI